MSSTSDDEVDNNVGHQLNKVPGKVEMEMRTLTGDGFNNRSLKLFEAGLKGKGSFKNHKFLDLKFLKLKFSSDHSS